MTKIINFAIKSALIKAEKQRKKITKELWSMNHNQRHLAMQNFRYHINTHSSISPEVVIYGVILCESIAHFATTNELKEQALKLAEYMNALLDDFKKKALVS